jgi:hypothetical protein
MPKHILITLLILMFFNLNGSSQTFYPGYIVKKNGEVIKGEIAAPGKNNTVKQISFKTGDKKEILTANDIAAFSRDNIDYQVAATIAYHTAGLENDQAKEEYSDEMVRDTTFLLQVIKGKYTLYQLQTTMRTCYFISKDNGPILELVARVKLASTNVIQYDNKYKSILAAYADEEGVDDKVKTEIMNSTYAYYSLKDAVINLNKKSGGSSVVKNTLIKSGRIEIGAGLNLTKFTATSISHDQGLGDFLSGTNFPASIDPRLVVAIQVGSSLRYTGVKGIITLGYSTALFKGSSPVIASSANQQMDFYKKFSILDISAGVMLLTQPANESSFFINPFVASNIIVNGSTVKNTGITPDFPKFANPYLGIGTGLGYIFATHRIELRGEYAYGNFRGASATVSNTKFSLSYHYALTRF